MILLIFSICLSEKPYSLTSEDLSAFGGTCEISYSFASREIRRSFLGTTCKIRSTFAMLRLGKQDDKGRL